MLSFILGVGTFYCSSAVQGGPWQLLGGFVVTFLSTTTFLRCALSNPGVLRAGSRSSALEAEAGLAEGGAESAVAADPLASAPDTGVPLRGRGRRLGGRHCDKCNIMQPRGCSHCEFCQVCVEGFDHHCPWMGKCIGKDNLCAFYTFIAVSMSSLGYIFALTLITSSSTLPPPVAGSS
mmetsp:Transcript_101021/g.204936  ORF Transcript_101021/g.204936 Transcript_101021/m.204936 type:complete len:178 (+) Transcript_101021:83-616(+)